MELEYSDRNSRRSKIYIAVGIIVALLVAATVFIALQASGLTDEGEVEMRQVVVAAAEIPGRKAIEEVDVVMRNVPVDPISDAALGSLDLALGRIAAVPITAGQLITPNLLASTDQGATFSILPPGEEFSDSMPDLRAVSMTVPDDRAVGGTLQPGQHPAILLHRHDRQTMRRRVVEVPLPLGGTHNIGERAATGDQDDASAAGR